MQCSSLVLIFLFLNMPHCYHTGTAYPRYVLLLPPELLLRLASDAKYGKFLTCSANLPPPTCRLSNHGNIPACFSFQPDPTGVFDIKPAVGLVPAGDFQVLANVPT